MAETPSPKVTNQCALHNKMEEYDTESIICGECGHVYRTEDDIVKEWHETMKDIPSAQLLNVQTAAQVTFCPLCLHDW